MESLRRSKKWNLSAAIGVSALCLVGTSYGQWTRTAPSTRLQYNTDNVGVGIQVPTVKFQVRDTTTAAGQKIVFLGTTVNTSCLPAIRLTDGTNTRTILGLRTGDIAVDNNGNVGIGKTNPGQILDISKSISGGLGPTFRLTNPNTTVNTESDIEFYTDHSTGKIQFIRTGYSNSPADIAFSTYRDDTHGVTEALRIQSTGFVGIGTTSPVDKLTITDGVTPYPTVTGEMLQIKRNTSNGLASAVTSICIGNNSNAFRMAYGGTSDRLGFVDGGAIERLSILNGGKIGIGTINPQSLLAVKGTITAQEIVVTTTGWSDFVFKKNYNLKPLNEVENYIKTNKHLEGIPTEKDVKAKGVAMGDMQAKLLQKIEELTLYTVELNKKTVELNEKVNQLTLANKELNKKIIGK